MSNNVHAGAWLLTDMCLHIIALSLVKSLGTDYPTMQIVFVRTLTGLCLLLPWVYLRRSAFINITHWHLHGARIFCSMLALSCGYYALARVPLALFTAINYLRPAVLMIMATLVLGSVIGQRRWLAVAMGFAGVLVAVRPDETPFGIGLAALFAAVLAGSAATILLRQLKGTSELVMMLFYTLGLTVLSAPFAWLQWRTMATVDTLSLITVGVFAQFAQYCFLKAHWLGDVGFLGPLGYASLLLSALAGFLFFDELPSLGFIAGATIIVFSAVLLRPSR